MSFNIGVEHAFQTCPAGPHRPVAISAGVTIHVPVTIIGAGLGGLTLAREFDGWAPELTALITDGDTAPVLRPLHALPVGHRWDRVPGVTLVGDAAPLSPPNGEGANLAMYDGAELGKAIAAHAGDVEAALTEYEQALFPRSTEAAAEAARDFELCYDNNAPHGLIALLTGHEHTF